MPQLPCMLPVATCLCPTDLDARESERKNYGLGCKQCFAMLLVERIREVKRLTLACQGLGGQLIDGVVEFCELLTNHCRELKCQALGSSHSLQQGLKSIITSPCRMGKPLEPSGCQLFCFASAGLSTVAYRVPLQWSIMVELASTLRTG